MRTLPDKLKAAADLLAARRQLAALEPHQVGQRVLLQGKVEALQAIVTGRATKAINLLAPRQTVAELARQWDALAEAPPEQREVAAAYMRMILQYAEKVNTQQGGGPIPEAGGLSARLWEAAGNMDRPEWQTAQAQRWIGSRHAARVEAVANEVKLRADEAQAARDRWKARIEALREVGRINDRPDVKAAADAYRNASGTHAQRAELWQAYQDTFARARREAEAAINAGKAEADRELETALAQLGQSADALRGELLAASPVTYEQSVAWAEAQEIDSAAKTAMKKLGYPVDQVRADVAEFYRLTGGRLAKVRIKAGGGRASASGIHGHKNRTIKMGAGFNKETLFHELGHHLEADPQVYAAARGFLLRRRESPTVYSLRTLTGNPGYGRQEGAYRDKWFNPYVGKVYRYNVTEVFSMGLESFCSPGLLAQRMAADPEHFKLIAGFLDNPPSELLEAVKEVLGQAADAEEEADEQAADLRDTTIKRLAAGAALTKLAPEPERLWSVGRDSQYEGSIDGEDARADLYAGKFRDYSTKRLKKGWCVARFHKGNGSLVSRNYFDRTEAIAAARVLAQTGEYPSGALSELQKTAEALQA